MAVVDEKVRQQATELKDAAFAYLRKAAEDTVFYVALGKCLKRELAEKYGLDENTTEGLLSQMAVELVDKIRLITRG